MAKAGHAGASKTPRGARRAVQIPQPREPRSGASLWIPFPTPNCCGRFLARTPLLSPMGPGAQTIDPVEPWGGDARAGPAGRQGRPGPARARAGRRRNTNRPPGPAEKRSPAFEQSLVGRMKTPTAILCYKSRSFATGWRGRSPPSTAGLGINITLLYKGAPSFSLSHPPRDPRARLAELIAPVSPPR